MWNEHILQNLIFHVIYPSTYLKYHCTFYFLRSHDFISHFQIRKEIWRFESSYYLPHAIHTKGRVNTIFDYFLNFKMYKKSWFIKKMSFFENNMNLYEKYLLWGPFGSTNGRTPPTIPQITVKSKTGTQEAPIFDWNSL